METTQITYDICRCYLQDQKRTITETQYDLLLGKIRARDHEFLSSCRDHPTLDVTGVGAMRTLLQIEAFFKKNASFAGPVSTLLAAFISFEEAELQCEDTNRRLDDFCVDQLSIKTSDDIHLKIERMQRYISQLLGNHRDFLREIPKLVRVTSGATASRSRRKSIPYLKISKKISCSPGAHKYLECLSQITGYGSLSPRFRSTNRVEFVPKSWKTDRTIACEPEGNMFLQLAFDKYAKSRLRRRGLDLSDQTKNQELAREGSITGNVATIDLSMASDTLAYNVVALLLPMEWFNFLRSVRSSTALIGSYKVEYAKFSSMGNGATFALETLVFAAACFACQPETFNVYGDDIIISTDKSLEVIQLLAFLGFTVNKSKTFLEGPFRESCGSNWFGGVDCTPKYIRNIDERKAVLCHIVNSMVHIASPYGKLWEYLNKFVKEHSLPLVPFNEDSMSGVWIHPHFAYQRKLIRTRNWIPKFKAFQAKSSRGNNFDSRSLFLWHLTAMKPRSASRVRFKIGDSNLTFIFESPNDSSGYAISSHKYVRKWVHWKPVTGASDHIYLWSEQLLREGPNFAN